MDILDDTYLDSLDAEIEARNERVKRQYLGSGMSPNSKLQQPATSQIAFRIYRPLHDRLKSISQRTGISQRKLLQNALVQYLTEMELRCGGAVFTSKG